MAIVRQGPPEGKSWTDIGLATFKRREKLMLQQFINHDGVLFKVYVVGDHIQIVPRPSFSNLDKVDQSGEAY
jgi:hypothetical protein